MATCYVTVPSWGIEGPAHRSRVLDRAARLCAALSWRLVPSPLLDAWCPGWGVGLPEEERCADLVRALGHDAVYAACGGHGGIHLVPALLAAPAPARPPILVGYSDTTVLHAAFLRRGWGGGAYSQVFERPDHGRCGLSLAAALRGEAFAIDHRAERSSVVARPGAAQGRVVAGCLSMLASLVGTGALPDLAGCILAVEDVDEPPFRLDDFLTQLHLAGALRGIVGLLGGAFPHRRREDEWGPLPVEVLRAWAERLGVPCIARLPFGHIQDHYAIPQGRPCAIEGGADGAWSIRFLEAGR